jgi:hypothetical chaperone protein
MSHCGIDFGTSNSLIASSPDGEEVTVHRVDPKNNVPELLPSLLFFDIRGRSAVGWEAWLSHVEMPDEMDARFLRSLKSALPDFAPGEAVRIFRRRYEIAELVAILLRRLTEAAEAELGERVTGAVLGRPVRFGETPLEDARAESTLREAAVLAGLDDARLSFMPEPEAVIRLFFAREGRSLDAVVALVFDFGGGTLDLCLARCGQGQPFEILATEGVRIGGTTLDRLLFEEKVLDHLGRGQQWGPGLELPTFLFHRLVNPDENWRLSDADHARTARHVLNATRAAGRRSAELESLTTVAAYRKGPEIFRALEDAKISLSERPESAIRYRYRNVELDERLGREEVRGLFDHELERIERLICRTLSDVGMRPADVDVVLLAGGSSNLLCAQELLRELFGAERVPIRDDMFTSVAQGLAIAAAQRARR